MGDQDRPDLDPDAAALAADYDLHSWAVSLGVSASLLRRTIGEVGHSAVAVRRRLLEDRAGLGAKVTTLSEPLGSK